MTPTQPPNPPQVPAPPAVQGPAASPFAPTPAPAKTYPRLKYRAIAEYPGFTYVKVNSAEEENALADPKNPANQPPAPTPGGTQPPLSTAPPPATPPDGLIVTGAAVAIPAPGAFQWFDTPGEAQLARAQGHRPYEEYGRSIDTPLGIPAPLMPQFISAVTGAMPPAAPAPAPENKYPVLKYQGIDDPPGFKYVKIASADDESALTGSNSGEWYDTPAEAIANKPQPKGTTAGQRPAQTGADSATGPAAPAGAGGAAVPHPEGQQTDAEGEGDKADDKAEGETKKTGNGKKHRW